MNINQDHVKLGKEAAKNLPHKILAPKKEKMKSKPKRIKAVFIGANGSDGYATNMQYVLIVNNSDNFYGEGRIHIERENGGGGCVYESFVAFLNNWDNIQNFYQWEKL
jgi:hypothetical protein